MDPSIKRRTPSKPAEPHGRATFPPLGRSTRVIEVVPSSGKAPNSTWAKQKQPIIHKGRSAILSVTVEREDSERASPFRRTGRLSGDHPMASAEPVAVSRSLRTVASQRLYGWLKPPCGANHPATGDDDRAHLARSERTGGDGGDRYLRAAQPLVTVAFLGTAPGRRQQHRHRCLDGRRHRLGDVAAGPGRGQSDRADQIDERRPAPGFA